MLKKKHDCNSSKWKRRAEIETNLGATEADVMEEIKNIKNVSEHIEDSKVIKRVYVPNKILNIVIAKNE